MEPFFMGQIQLFAGNFAPRGWALCNGQLLAINNYQALFSILGTTYGGDGRTTFGLPDLRGRVPVHAGNGPGLQPRSLGQKAGNSSTTLDISHMPSHTHVATANVSGLNARVSSASGTEEEGADNVLGNAPNPNAYVDGAATENMRAGSIGGSITVETGLTGNAIPFSNEQPYLGLNYIIALFGTFPSRN